MTARAAQPAHVALEEAMAEITDRGRLGRELLERVRSARREPHALEPFVLEFEAVQRELESAARNVERARISRDEALEAAGVAHDELDASLVVLGGTLVKAGLGSRKNPLRRYSRHTLGELFRAGHAMEAHEVGELAIALRKVRPPRDVLVALATAERYALAVIATIDSLAQRQATYESALSAHDALLPRWSTARRRLERHAASVIAPLIEPPARTRSTKRAADRVRKAAKTTTKRTTHERARGKRTRSKHTPRQNPSTHSV